MCAAMSPSWSPPRHRPCLTHFCFGDIAAAVEIIRRSDIDDLLTTTFTSEPANREITTGDWRPQNPELPPFQFPPPPELLDAGCTEQEGGSPTIVWQPGG
jgi:hypothetical protein